LVYFLAMALRAFRLNLVPLGSAPLCFIFAISETESSGVRSIDELVGLSDAINSKYICGMYIFIF
jgi:hypothetical protein